MTRVQGGGRRAEPEDRSYVKNTSETRRVFGDLPIKREKRQQQENRSAG
jgi:hypothetical protein